MDRAVSHPADLTNEALQNAISELAACITIATAQLLQLIAELDRREAWGGAGLRSCAHWLNWKCGIGLGAAREKVRVARALETLPKIAAAFASGTVSYSKVRAMTRVATPDNEEYLLMIAHHGTAAHVETLVRGVRRVERIEAASVAGASHANRSLKWHWDDDGSLVIAARLPAESGALVLKALETACGALDPAPEDENVSAETSCDHEPYAARRADALAAVAGAYLAGDGTPARQADRYQVLVHANPALDARIDDGPPLSKATAERIACDAAVIALQSDPGGNPLNIGRKSRTVPPAMRRALEHRDPTCRFPGCTSHRFTDAHHIEHWAHGGGTSLANLVRLCTHHHHCVHERGFTIERRDDGRLLFFTPGGQVIPDVPDPVVPGTRVEDIADRQGVDVSAETLLPAWCGESMDLGLAVEGLLAASPTGPIGPA